MTEPTLVAPTRGSGSTRGGFDLDRPFARLAVVHLLSMAGDALLAISLASSLFFDVDPSEGRQKVLIGLLLTMAPFAIVGPLIGPAMDRLRGGHRAMIIGTAAARAVVAIAMAFAIAADSWLLFPEAFVMLVLAKSYQVAKAAVVPTVVTSDDELVEANSKLQVLGGISGFMAAIPGGILYLFGAQWVAVGCSVVFVVATVAAFRVPSVQVAPTAAEPDEVAELRSTLVVSAASAMAVLRGVVGFVTMLLAFELRGGGDMSRAETLARNVARGMGEVVLRLEVLPVDEPPRWYFGVVVPLSVAGGLAGASLAPWFRRSVREERILAGALGLAAIAGLLAVLFDGLLAYSLLCFLVALAASAAKQAFDAVVQRDAPDANRGRSFARFEARFQVVWVAGALVPVAFDLPVGVGGAVVLVSCVTAGVMYTATGFPDVAALGSRAATRARWFRARGARPSGRTQPPRSGKSGMSGTSSSSGSG
ncbi:MAG TPA: MFS transporter [Microthrixaceae bacterium]|nr:MFS transporter [Microthrixaceae bacterium]